MPANEQDFCREVSALGYESEKEMLVDLYSTYSLSEMAKILGYSTFCIRRKMILLGIKLRPRGGTNNKGNRILKDVSDELLARPTKEVAELFNVHDSTVHGERRLRRALSSDSTMAAHGGGVGVGAEAGALEEASADVLGSPGFEESSLPGVLQEAGEGREDGDTG